MAKDETVRVKLIVVDEYLSFQHGLYSGMEMDAVPNYTSTKKLKGYKVKSKRDRKDIYVNINEIETL